MKLNNLLVAGLLVAVIPGGCKKVDPPSPIVKKVQDAGAGDVSTASKESIEQWFKQHHDLAKEIVLDCNRVKASKPADWADGRELQVEDAHEPRLSPEMERQGIRLQTSVGTSVSYMGFNMLDPVVGGNSERARKLRLAISIALDEEENISIFRNGRGIAAQGPIPPGIFGYLEGEAGINHYVYDWVSGEPRRKPLLGLRHRDTRSVPRRAPPHAGAAQSRRPASRRRVR